MSHQATAWAIRQEVSGGPTAKLVLLVLAHHADPMGAGWAGRKLQAAEAQCSDRTITRALAHLEECSLIARVRRYKTRGEETRRTSDWFVLAPRSVDRGEMHDADPDEYPDEVAELAQKGSGDKSSGEPESSPRGHSVQVQGTLSPSSGDTGVQALTGRGTVREKSEEQNAAGQLFPTGEPELRGPTGKIDGHAIKPEAWELTKQLLDEYCQATGQRRGALTGNGKPSDSAKRIYLRLIEHPEVTYEQGVAIIRAVLARPWWTGQPSVGVIFGPTVFEDNLNREPQVQGVAQAQIAAGLRPPSDLGVGHRENARRVMAGRRDGADDYTISQANSSNARLLSAGIELVFDDTRLIGWRQVTPR